VAGRIDEEFVALGGLFGLDIDYVLIRELCMERNPSRLDGDTSFLTCQPRLSHQILGTFSS